jgi:hypothetical protein
MLEDGLFFLKNKKLYFISKDLSGKDGLTSIVENFSDLLLNENHALTKLNIILVQEAAQ